MSHLAKRPDTSVAQTSRAASRHIVRLPFHAAPVGSTPVISNKSIPGCSKDSWPSGGETVDLSNLGRGRYQRFAVADAMYRDLLRKGGFRVCMNSICHPVSRDYSVTSRH